MTTIAEFMDDSIKEILKEAIYEALGEELTNELNSAGCELIIMDDLKNYEFTNTTPELEAKINLKKLNNG